ncbi:hypothetical protein IEQ34_005252 [Dendrobium chrysotoxum]|uniref:Uncharacterized protein n=1 Tax=Dendrobium chrysotoxum TaxID=161865 RepID=A0AAV7GUI3_DENCH|nr:hypothetical protein IEQ34_005252 [Dendrobium chrysotoxum]
MAKYEIVPDQYNKGTPGYGSEHNATDGNTDGNNEQAGRNIPVVPSMVQPPGGSSSATIDIFTQMMAAVIHLI